MKRLVFVWLAFSWSVVGETEEEFLALVKDAYGTKSIPKIKALHHADEMNELTQQIFESSLKRLEMKPELKSVSLVGLDPGFSSMGVSMGRKWELTIKAEGMVDLDYSREGNALKSKIPFGLVDGKRKLLIGTVTKLDWEGPQDQLLFWRVEGEGAKGTTVDVKWNASGVELEERFVLSERLGTSNSFPGQYIEELTVSSTADDVEVTFEISENQKVIFESEVLRGKGELVYKRKE